ncbi:MAG: aminobutyraldehyde dehydrogenase [Actinomycetota bacterium]
MADTGVPSTFATAMLIDGELVEGAGDSVDVIDPATGSTITSLAAASDEQTDAAMAAAARAFEWFGRHTPIARSLLLHQIADVIEEHSEELAALESLDVGKPWPSAHDDEMPLTIDTFRFMAGAARTMTGLAAGEYVEHHTSMIRRDPIGPVAAIAPWNYPLMMAAWKLAAPLAAGCPVTLKPSEITPLSTLRLAALLADVVPAGVVNIVHGTGPEVGERMLNHPETEGISITGSPATGMAAMRAASQQIRHVHLELGGKAPVIVFDDADVDAVVGTIREGSFFNAGQDCAQPARIFATPGVYDEIVAGLQAQVGEIVTGGPREPATEMGPLVSARHRDRVAGFVDRARAQAEVVVGGTTDTGGGFFYAPTVVADVDRRAEIACDEVFGPVVTVTRVADADDAVAAANAGRYGLASSIWTANVGTAASVASQLRYGFTWVNTHGVATPEMPWAAMKGSGTGCDMSVFSLDAYTAVRHVMIAH